MRFTTTFALQFSLVLVITPQALASTRSAEGSDLIEQARRLLTQDTNDHHVDLDFRLSGEGQAMQQLLGGARKIDANESWSTISPGFFQDEQDPAALPDPGDDEDIFLTKHEDQIDYDHDGDVDAGDLARAVQNPVADMISLPFQNNFNTDVGALNNEQNILNIQPVIPISLNDEWNLITRTIIPVVYQPSLFKGDDYDFGLGDIQFTAFFSPVKPINGWILGGGPIIRMPTATDSRLGQRKWSLGPSVVALTMNGPWVVGGLFQNVWSVAGSGKNSVNEFLFQPFVNYNLEDGWYLTSSPVITANWQADSDNQWTIPVGGGFGKIFRIGDQPMNAQFQAFYNVETSSFGPEWTIRFQLQFLFPR